MYFMCINDIIYNRLILRTDKALQTIAVCTVRNQVCILVSELF